MEGGGNCKSTDSALGFHLVFSATEKQKTPSLRDSRAESVAINNLPGGEIALRVFPLGCMAGDDAISLEIAQSMVGVAPSMGGSFPGRPPLCNHGVPIIVFEHGDRVGIGYCGRFPEEGGEILADGHVVVAGEFMGAGHKQHASVFKGRRFQCNPHR